MLCTVRIPAAPAAYRAEGMTTDAPDPGGMAGRDDAAVMPPSGTVTFLFSDIEGSTRRWDLNRQAMQEAVRLHDRIVRDAIAAHGGYVFKTIGDAFCAAFRTPESAALAATDAQRALAVADFSSRHPIYRSGSD